MATKPPPKPVPSICRLTSKAKSKIRTAQFERASLFLHFFLAAGGRTRFRAAGSKARFKLLDSASRLASRNNSRHSRNYGPIGAAKSAVLLLFFFVFGRK